MKLLDKMTDLAFKTIDPQAERAALVALVVMAVGMVGAVLRTIAILLGICWLWRHL